jgi:hypothetical protein
MDPTMATTMSREEVRRIAWRVSMPEWNGVLTTSGTRSRVLLGGPESLGDESSGGEATSAARFEAGRDRALAADKRGGDPG